MKRANRYRWLMLRAIATRSLHDAARLWNWIDHQDDPEWRWAEMRDFLPWAFGDLRHCRPVSGVPS